MSWAWLALVLGCGPGTVEVDPDTCTLEAGTGVLVWEDVTPGNASTRAVSLAVVCDEDPGPVAWTATLAGSHAGRFEVEPASGALDRVGDVLEVRLLSSDGYAPVEARLDLEADTLAAAVDLVAHALADRDGDGHDAVEAGGGDCDDYDPAVHPGADDPPWDGVDADCGGEDDCDLDGDGFAAVPCGGDDCDDTDAGQHPGTGTDEVANGLDDDCDGLVDEDFVGPEDVLVVEVMVEPAATLDQGGQWLEVECQGPTAVDLRGWRVRSGSGQEVVLPDHLVLEPGERAVLGSTTDASRTGGARVDLAWTWGELALDGEDSVTLEVAGAAIHTLEWDERWPVEPGASLSLHPGKSWMGRGYWCASSTPMSGGDRGTPGEVNDRCGQIDEDGDAWSPDDGDCDDTDPEIHPDADEAWNEVDDDCNGIVDDVDIEDVAVGSVDGSSGYFLGARFALGTLDMDDDGDLDLLVGATAHSNAGGWLVDGAMLLKPSGLVRGVGTRNVRIASYCCVVGPLPGDVDGDGVDDVVVGAKGRSSQSMAVLAWYSGAETSTHGELEAKGLEELPRLVSHLDLDGDGLDEAALGVPAGTAQLGDSGSGLGVVLAVDLDEMSGTVHIGAPGCPYLVGTEEHDHLGSTVGGGDLDGDGYDDLLVGAGGDDLGGVGAGAVYLLDAAEADWLGEAPGDVAEWVVTGVDPWENLGATGYPQVADFDDDGVADLAVASPAIGAVYVFLGDGAWSGATTVDDADLVIDGSGVSGFLGTELVTGDLDGDGVPELIASAPDTDAEYRPDTPDELGAVYAFQITGAGAWTPEDAWRSVVGRKKEHAFGLGVVAADLDGDGADDLVIAAPGDIAGDGRVYGVLSP